MRISGRPPALASALVKVVRLLTVSAQNHNNVLRDSLVILYLITSSIYEPIIVHAHDTD